MSREYLWQVSHPDLGDITVPAPDRPGAVMAACIQWGLGRDWSWMAGHCTVRKLGTAERPKCRRCGSAFGRPGDGPGLCVECQRKERYFEREKRAMFRYDESRRKRQRLA